MWLGFVLCLCSDDCFPQTCFIYYNICPSVTLEPPIGLWSMQNRTFLVLLRPIFGEKLKTAPPPKEIGCRSCEVHVVIWPEKAFEFPISAKKLVSILVKTFFFFFFFFGDHLFLGWKNVWFPILAEKSVLILVNSGQGRLHFSHSFKKAPPPFFKCWLRAWTRCCQRLATT